MKNLRKVHMFFGRKAEYIKGSEQISDEEFKRLKAVRADDLLVLSRKPVFWDKNDQGMKLGKVLQDLVNDGAILAYVINTKTPKGVGQNYHTILVSPEGYRTLDEYPEEFEFCYSYESFLSHQR